MKRYSHHNMIIAVTLIAFALVGAAPVRAQLDPRTHRAPALEFEAPEVAQFTTDNGLRVVFLESHELPVVRITLYFPGGAIYESNDLCGASEITASLMRSGGTGKMSGEQIDEELDFLAATIKSAATRDKLFLEMRCLKKDFARVFELFARILSDPRFDSARMALEISNLSDEIRRQFDSPTAATRHLFYETVYGKSYYGRNPTLSSLSHIQRNTIRKTYEYNYAPTRGIMAVSGDLTREELASALDKHLAKWKGDTNSAGAAPLASPPAEKVRGKPGVYYAFKDISQTSIRLGHVTDLFESPDRYAVRVTNYAVGVGFTGRLLSKVRSEAGLAYSVGSYFVNRPKLGTFFAYCQTRAGATTQALQMVIDIISEVKLNGITEEEFERAKESILNSFVFEYETPHQVAESVAESMFYGFPAAQSALDLEALNAVTFDDCRQAALKYYRPEDFVIVVVGDTTQMDGPLSKFGKVSALSLEIK
ncbi:MAG: M16 family metallopeptidase [Candidatus Zixiibacteriota bacterium]